jgi:hypothetical protein
VATVAAAQPAPDRAALLSQVDAAYAALDYGGAEALARRALAAPEGFTPDQLVRLHTTLGLLLFTRNEPLEAAEQFRAALSLDRSLSLDPVLVSPVTLAFFEETKATFLRERAVPTPAGAAPVYVLVADPRPAAARRSLVLPGWGQRHLGSRVEGWAMTALWAATLGGGGASHRERARAREAYLAAPDSASATARYRTYNAWHKARGGLLLGAGVVWGWSLVDVLLSRRPPAPTAPTRLAVGPAGAGLRLRVAL